MSSQRPDEPVLIGSLRAPRPPELAMFEDPPPLLGSWRNLYAVVLGNLVLMVLLFSLITWVYA